MYHRQCCYLKLNVGHRGTVLRLTCHRATNLPKRGFSSGLVPRRMIHSSTFWCLIIKHTHTMIYSLYLAQHSTNSCVHTRAYFWISIFTDCHPSLGLPCSPSLRPTTRLSQKDTSDGTKPLVAPTSSTTSRDHFLLNPVLKEQYKLRWLTGFEAWVKRATNDGNEYLVNYTREDGG